jgi:hypothetical protein
VNDPLQELLDIEAIKRLKAKYFRLQDHKQWEEWRNVFTDDLHYEFSAEDSNIGRGQIEVDSGDADGDDSGDGAPIQAVGADAFVAFASQVLKEATTVHHGYTPEVELTGPVTARGTWAMDDYIEFPSGNGRNGLHGYGHYVEEYRKENGEWRISSLLLTRLRIDPL